MTLIVVAAILALVAVAIAGILFDYAHNSQRNTLADEAAMLASLKGRIIEFVAKNKRLPSLTTASEYQTLSGGFTDRLGRTPIYLYSGVLDTADICSATTSLISLRDCGADVACAGAQVTANVPFVLLLPGSAIANTLSVVSQTTTQTGSAGITSTEVLTRFAPGVVVGRVANRSQEIGVYDDVLTLSDFAELKKAAGCLSVSQGGIVDSGTSVKILNSTASLPPALVGAQYSTATAPFVAYGSPGSTYSWTASGLPPGLTLVTSGDRAYISSSSIPVTAPANAYSVTVTVTATAPNGNAPTSSVTKPLVVCPYWAPTGATQTVSCPAGFSGAISQSQVTETCTGTTQWIDTANSCVAIPVPVEVAFTSAALTAAGINTSVRNLGVSSITVNGVTVSAGSNGTTFGDRNISINSVGNALGVVTIGGSSGYSMSGTESLKFQFPAASDTTSVAFASLSSGETATVTFYSGALLLGSRTKISCSNSTFVAFKDIGVGVPFDRFTVTPSGSASFYVAGVKACPGSSCQVSMAATVCP